jgi:hypothetical protein
MLEVEVVEVAQQQEALLAVQAAAALVEMQTQRELLARQT